ncbi:MAG: epoxyqueuosine reductase QueH, partial [Salinivirgaceae bacterium]|nr:epoxyqueuosine reductase QueH [Salinivirgaceae bacterium]
ENEYGLRNFITSVYPDFDNRCSYCYESRIYRTAEFAAENGFDRFTTTLLVSPYQNHELICDTAERAAFKYGVKFEYHDFRPGFKAGQEKARELGYVTTIKGRKRMLPDINSRNAVVRGFAERNAVNAPIQGSAADIIKIAMIRIANEIKTRGMKSRMILQVHDELVFNVYTDELETLRRLVVDNMENAYSGKVPLEVGVGVGANWLEAH